MLLLIIAIQSLFAAVNALGEQENFFSTQDYLLIALIFAVVYVGREVKKLKEANQ